MRVHLLFFDLYRDLAETDAMVVEFFESVCVDDLVSELRARNNGLSLLPAKPVVAVNMHYASLATTLNDGDLVAFIPPQAGR
jgi:molybdopterin converting factor small subunit